MQTRENWHHTFSLISVNFHCSNMRFSDSFSAFCPRPKAPVQIDCYPCLPLLQMQLPHCRINHRKAHDILRSWAKDGGSKVLGVATVGCKLRNRVGRGRGVSACVRACARVEQYDVVRTKSLEYGGGRTGGGGGVLAVPSHNVEDVDQLRSSSNRTLLSAIAIVWEVDPFQCVTGLNFTSVKFIPAHPICSCTFDV